MHNRWDTVLAVDSDRWASATYSANFPGVPVVTGSVADAIDRLPDADVVLGGPPCQPHSLAGKRKASTDVRDGGPDFVAAVAKVRPRMFLMENVPGLLTSEGGAYAARLLSALEAAGPGYVVQIKTLDAVNYGVPQFRERCWWWGIRSDVYAAGVRHGWPAPTHAWPPPEGPGLFGDALLPGVTVGEALGLDGWYDAQNDRAHDGDEPCGTIQGVAQGRGGNAGHYALLRHRGAGWGDRPVAPATEPSPTITRAGSGQGGSTGAIYLQPHADPAQPVTIPPPTLRSGGARHDGCCLRMQDVRDIAKRQNSVGVRSDGPAYTVDGMATQGVAIDSRGLDLRVVGGGSNPRHPGGERTERDITNEPSTTIPAGDRFSNSLPEIHAGAVEYRWSDAYRAKHPPASPASSVVGQWHKGLPNGALIVAENWKRKGDLWVRRLSPLECARLQSVPDTFVWPDGIPKTHAYRVIGNGWACGAAAVMSRALADADLDSRTVVDLFCGGGLGASGWHGRHWTYAPELEASCN